MHHKEEKSHIVEGVLRDRYGVECVIEENGGEAAVIVYRSVTLQNGLFGEFVRSLLAAGEYDSVTLYAGDLSAPLRAANPGVRKIGTYAEQKLVS